MKILFVALVAVACVATTASAQVSRDRSGTTHIGSGTACYYKMDGRWATEPVDGNRFYGAVYNFAQKVAAQNPSACATARIKGIANSGKVYGKPLNENRVRLLEEQQSYFSVESQCQFHFTCYPTPNEN